MESSSSGNQPILTGQTETFKKLAWNGWMTRLSGQKVPLKAARLIRLSTLRGLVHRR